MRTWLIALSLTALPALAHADDCLDRATAHVAGREIVAFCEPCGDRAPGIPMIANGNLIDPAHTYVRVAADRFANVALLVGCPIASGVSPSLDVSDETSDGVLITASNKPVALASTTSLTPVAPPAPAAAAASTTHYYTTTIDRVPAFAIWIGAGGLGFGLGVGMTLGALALRRRRAMEPRATKLA